jgi:hypothetical protein
MNSRLAGSAKNGSAQTNQGLRATAWIGHSPGTSARLTTILERVVQGSNDFTLQERIFVTACEFWVLAMHRELHARTELKAIGKLRFASRVFDAIGAAGVAGALQSAHSDLAHPQSRALRQRRLKLLEDRLLLSADPVDALLARFAENLAASDILAVDRGTDLVRKSSRTGSPAFAHL